VLGQAEVGVVKVLVDHTNHAVLAVVADGLRAVVPGRLIRSDHNLEHIRVLALLGREIEAGEETGAVGERLARVGKVGLRNGVVEGQELPLDNVTNLSDDVVRLELETAEAGRDRVSDAGEGYGAVGGVPDGPGGHSGSAGGEEESGDGGLGEHVCGC